MKFTVTLFGHHPLHRPSPQNFSDVLELARNAEELGFDMVWAGHHFMVAKFQKFQVIPALARVAGETSRVLINATELLPLNHPIRVAEELATLDALSNGRVVLTAAMGYSGHEFGNFGIDRRHRLGRFLEALEIIKRVWIDDNVSFEGKHFRLSGVTINPKPAQKPRPPIWVTADAVKGVIRAAKTGDVWLMSSHTRIAELKEQLALYRQHWVAPTNGARDIGISVPLMRVTYIARTQAEALERARPHIEKTWRVYYGMMQQAAEMDDPGDFTKPYEELWRDRFLLGDSVFCAEEIARYRDELGIDCIHFNLAGTSEEQLSSLRLIGTGVIPRFR